MRLAVQSGLLRLYPLDLALELGILGAYVIPDTAERLLRESHAYLQRLLAAPERGDGR